MIPQIDFLLFDRPLQRGFGTDPLKCYYIVVIPRLYETLVFFVGWSKSVCTVTDGLLVVYCYG